MTQADDFRSRIAELSPAERSAAMLARIRSMPIVPYTEGSYVLRILQVAGRVSGEIRSTPIGVVRRHDKLYVCAPNRSRDWVRNLLAAGMCRLETDETEYKATLAAAEEGAPALGAYLGQLGRVSEEWPFGKGASNEEIAEHWDTIAVFRLDPA